MGLDVELFADNKWPKLTAPMARLLYYKISADALSIEHHSAPEDL
jgi:hypothetical protein